MAEGDRKHHSAEELEGMAAGGDHVATRAEAPEIEPEARR